MNVLWVLAHPDGRSLNASLHREGVAALRDAGHHVEISDLYAMKWNPVVDAGDFGSGGEGPGGERLRVDRASQRALEAGTLSPDIRAEQDKLDRAGLVVLQFPLWWFGMPAILKGWIDRVFIRGYAYSIPDPDRPGRSLRYGTGGLAGKRALAVVTVGAAEEGYQPRGIEGSVEDLLFPLLHGTFFYTGMSPLPPVVVYSANHLPDSGYEAAAAQLRARLAAAPAEPPIPYRPQNGGDYDDRMLLRPHVAPGTVGFAAHRRLVLRGSRNTGYLNREASVLLNSKGQVTIPAHLREKYGLHAGDEIEVVDDDGTLRIIRAPRTETRGQRLTRRLRSTATGQDVAGMSTDEIMALLRDE